MLDTKQVVKFPASKITPLNIGGAKVSVKAYLSAEEMDTLTAIYMSALTGENGSIAYAERSLIVSVIETVTDIKLVEDGVDGSLTPLVTVDEIFANYSFWIKIKLAVENYDYFRKILDETIEEYRENRRLSMSLGVKLENILDGIRGFVEKLSSGEGLSQETIAETRGFLKEINESPLLQEAVQAFKSDQKKPASPKTKRATSKKTKAK